MALRSTRATLLLVWGIGSGSATLGPGCSEGNEAAATTSAGVTGGAASGAAGAGGSVAGAAGSVTGDVGSGAASGTGAGGAGAGGAGGGEASGAGGGEASGSGGGAASACDEPRDGDASACWEGNRSQCQACVPPDGTLHPCVGAGEQPAPIEWTPEPCTTDADCVRPGQVCEPSHPLANAQGCRPATCMGDTDCPQGTVCDPDHPDADQFSTPVLALLQMICSGTSALPLNPSRECAAGCRVVACDEPGGEPCNPVHCDEAGADACAEGERCDPTAPGTGCVKIRCDLPGGASCPEGRVCAPTSGSPDGCAECADNADCGCGYCVSGRCYRSAGTCELGCA